MDLSKRKARKDARYTKSGHASPLESIPIAMEHVLFFGTALYIILENEHRALSIRTTAPQKWQWKIFAPQPNQREHNVWRGNAKAKSTRLPKANCDEYRTGRSNFDGSRFVFASI